MNFLRKSLALLLAVSLFCCFGAFAFYVGADEIGTAENPENANDRYFSMAKCYLINTDLSEGDSDGYWYIYTSDGSGIVCLDATAKDAKGNSTDDFQVTVECNGETYYAIDEIFTRPIAPFRVKRGDVLKIHFTAKADKNGKYPQIKIYANISTVYGNENSPVPVKSAEGFIANIETQRTVVYQDATNGGLYGGKGLVVSGPKSVISKTEVIVNNVVYTDTDNDGTIELMLPGDPTAMIAAHPIITIYNGSKHNATYVSRLTSSASESSTVNVCSHTLSHYERVEPCHRDGNIEYWYCKKCDTYFSDPDAKVLTDREYIILFANGEKKFVEKVEPTCSAYGVSAHWYCDGCGGCFAAEESNMPLEPEILLIDKLPHDPEYKETVTESTFTENGIAVFVCKACGEEFEDELPLLSHYMKGDLNNDGDLNAVDANLIKRFLVGFPSTIQELDSADYNDDGQLNAIDSALLKRAIAGLSN